MGPVPCLEEFETDYEKDSNSILIYVVDLSAKLFECKSFIGESFNDAHTRAITYCRSDQFYCTIVARGKFLEPWVHEDFWYSVSWSVMADQHGYSNFRDWIRSNAYEENENWKDIVNITMHNTPFFKRNLFEYVKKFQALNINSVLSFHIERQGNYSNYILRTRDSTEDVSEMCRRERLGICLVVAKDSFFSPEFTRQQLYTYATNMRIAEWENSPEGRAAAAETQAFIARKNHERNLQAQRSRADRERNVEMLRQIASLPATSKSQQTTSTQQEANTSTPKLSATPCTMQITNYGVTAVEGPGCSGQGVGAVPRFWAQTNCPVSSSAVFTIEYDVNFALGGNPNHSQTVRINNNSEGGGGYEVVGNASQFMITKIHSYFCSGQDPRITSARSTYCECQPISSPRPSGSGRN